jgi:hypothetical protein
LWGTKFPAYIVESSLLAFIYLILATPSNLFEDPLDLVDHSSLCHPQPRRALHLEGEVQSF